MRKLIILTILLLLADIFLYKYLNSLRLEKKEFRFEVEDEKIIYQTSDIRLNEIKDFNFDNYFYVISFNNNSYRYEIDDEYIIVHIHPDKTYRFKYELIEPKVITETVFIEKPIEIQKPVYQEVENENYIESDYFYVDNDYFSFSLDTDLDDIRNILKSNIHTSYETDIDYSELNVSHVGQYKVVYSCSNEKIEIIIEIV